MTACQLEEVASVNLGLAVVILKELEKGHSWWKIGINIECLLLCGGSNDAWCMLCIGQCFLLRTRETSRRAEHY